MRHAFKPYSFAYRVSPLTVSYSSFFRPYLAMSSADWLSWPRLSCPSCEREGSIDGSPSSRPLSRFLEFLASRPHIFTTLLREHRSCPLGQLLAIRICNHQRPTTPQHLTIELHFVSRNSTVHRMFGNIPGLRPRSHAAQSQSRR